MADLFFNQTVARLATAGIPSPRLETRMIFAHIAGVESNAYDPAGELSPSQRQEAEILIARRAAHEPLDKILGHRAFYKYDFLVNDQVLSPRSDSEVLVETALELIEENQLRSVLELGVGSGCLLLSLLADRAEMTGVGADISKTALAVAQKNADRLGVKNRVRLIEFDYFKDYFTERFDLIVSNPPYIPSADIKLLEPEVKKYDPLQALDGGADGLEHYRQIARTAGNWLNAGGYLILEAGIGQAEDIIDVCSASGWQPIGVKADLNGIKRCIILKK